MNEFEYTIKDENGIHARPAGLLAKEAQRLPFDLTLECKGKSVDPKKLLALMGMGIKKGDTVKVTAERGCDLSNLKSFFENNL